MTRYTPPRPIQDHDDTTAFESGEPSLDDWLRRRALTNQATGASRCFVTCQEDHVVGYYALSGGSILRSDTSRRTGHGMPHPVPAILLGRLAVDRKEQGHHLGSHLLRDAITRAVTTGEIIGVCAILAHALHEPARNLYLHSGFEPSPTHPLHLMLLMKDARALCAPQVLPQQPHRS